MARPSDSARPPMRGGGLLAEVKERADILQIIGEKVALKPAGSSYKGLCPFHSEKTPSFTVNPSRRIFHCYGCNVGGSVVDFVMAYERLDFVQALRALAERLGLDPGRSRGGPKHEGLRALELARRYFGDNLLQLPEAEPAREYLKGRRFDEDAWRAFGLGYARNDWRAFTEHALGQGLTLADLTDSGLVRVNESGRPFDMLRGRITIPILDPGSRCIAFGGRVLPGAEGPKYLNTPETRHYHKSHVLFGLAQGQDAVRQGRRAILVEGYLDVMRMHLSGFRQAVATCGTALTAEHLKLLERYADRVVLLFDGDEAGIKAALRSAPLFLNRGMEARVALLPDALDPDDFIAQRGAEAFGTQVEQAQPLLEFLVLTTLKRSGTGPEAKQRTLKTLAPVLAEIKEQATRELAVRHLADLVEVRADAIFALLPAARNATIPGPRGRPGRPPEPETQQTEAAARGASDARRELRHQRLVLALLLRQRGLLPVARQLLLPEDLSDVPLRTLYETLLRLTPEQVASLDPAELAESFPGIEAPLRALLVDEPIHVRLTDREGHPALADAEAALRAEIARVKEAEKDRLFQHLRRALGTPEEEMAVRRFLRLRTELRDAMTESRGIVAPPGDASVGRTA
jgi:DNA primase